MTVPRGFGIVFISAMTCALIGAGVGYGLGVAAPAYYRGVFRGGNDPSFDPVQVGLGLGLTQGLIAGLLVGCAVVLAVAWHNSRRQVVIQEWSSDRAPRPAGTAPGASEAFRPPGQPGGAG